LTWRSGLDAAEIARLRTRIAKQATEAAEKRTAYNAENDRLRAALSETAAALGNGSSVSPDCSVEFLREVPGEVKAVVSGLHAELATANERAATLEREIDRLRKALMEAGSLAERRGEEIVKLNAAANRQHAADKWESQAVRLEWSPWDADKETDLRATFGGFSAYIARITIDSQVTAKLYYTDTTNGETVTITGLDLAKIEPILSTLVEAAGFTMPPIPALPVQE
jgi:regulator of replication initiation timing